MQKILKKFKKYYPWYDREHKILSFQGKMYVEEFMYLRYLLRFVKEEVKDIRINI